jgi:hypothetical protein
LALLDPYVDEVDGFESGRFGVVKPVDRHGRVKGGGLAMGTRAEPIIGA